MVTAALLAGLVGAGSEPIVRCLTANRYATNRDIMPRRQTPEQARTKRFILRLARRGLFTVSECALIARVNKKTVQRWCDEAMIDPVKARLKLIMSMKASAEQEAAGLGVREDRAKLYLPRSGPTRAQRQKMADRANQDWAMRRADQGEIEAEEQPTEAPDEDCESA